MQRARRAAGVLARVDRVAGERAAADRGRNARQPWAESHPDQELGQSASLAGSESPRRTSTRSAGRRRRRSTRCARSPTIWGRTSWSGSACADHRAMIASCPGCANRVHERRRRPRRRARAGCRDQRVPDRAGESQQHRQAFARDRSARGLETSRSERDAQGSGRRPRVFPGATRSAPGSGFGLVGLAERVRMLGGTLAVSVPGRRNHDDGQPGRTGSAQRSGECS